MNTYQSAEMDVFDEAAEHGLILEGLQSRLAANGRAHNGQPGLHDQTSPKALVEKSLLFKFVV